MGTENTIGRSRSLRVLMLLGAQPEQWFDIAAINVAVPSTTDRHSSSLNGTALCTLMAVQEIERKGTPRFFRYRITARGLNELRMLEASGSTSRPNTRLSGAASPSYEPESRDRELTDRPLVIRNDASATKAPSGLVRSVFDLGLLSGPTFSQPTTQGAGHA